MFKLILTVFFAGLLFIPLKAEILVNADKSPAKIVSLPKPTGKYKIGTTTYFWKDKNREELWTFDPKDSRRLMVQIWYPADENIKGRKAPYIFDLEEIGLSIKKYWEDMPEIKHQSYLNLAVAKAEKNYPVLVFSHGMNSSRFLYTSISQELASQGYIVASIDHTYWGPGVAFPDGKHVTFDEGMIARDKLDFNEIDRMMLEGITVMSADQAFVAGKLKELNAADKKFRGRLDLSRTGAIGHSMGGMAATASCLKYTAFKTCISLDGVNYFLNRMPHPSTKPFLLLLNSQWGKNAPPKIKKSYLEAWENPSVFIINGTKHNFYSDLPLIEPPEKKDGLIEPRRAFQIISSYTVSFLDRYLKGQEQKIVQYKEMEPIDLKTVKSPESKKEN